LPGEKEEGGLPRSLKREKGKRKRRREAALVSENKSGVAESRGKKKGKSDGVWYNPEKRKKRKRTTERVKR